MTQRPTTVLDASALLAYLQGELGAKVVTDALVHGAAMSAVNWAEVLSKLAERGQEPDTVTAQLTAQGLLNNVLQVYAVDEALACAIAQLRLPTRALGLSLGDRACLALAMSLKLPALTTDRVWANLNIDVQVSLIR